MRREETRWYIFLFIRARHPIGRCLFSFLIIIVLVSLEQDPRLSLFFFFFKTQTDWEREMDLHASSLSISTREGENCKSLKCRAIRTFVWHRFVFQIRSRRREERCLSMIKHLELVRRATMLARWVRDAFCAAHIKDSDASNKCQTDSSGINCSVCLLLLNIFSVILYGNLVMFRRTTNDERRTKNEESDGNRCILFLLFFLDDFNRTHFSTELMCICWESDAETCFSACRSSSYSWIDLIGINFHLTNFNVCKITSHVNNSQREEHWCTFVFLV